MRTTRLHCNCDTASQFFLLISISVLCGRSLAQVYNLSLSIEEGLPAGTIVGDINALLPEGTSRSGFFISESRESDVFKDLEIDGDTGIISTAVVLDRESREKYEFVAATLTGEMIKVKIVVRDVNDHSPAFTRDVVELNISEQSPPGTRFQLEGALDEDDGEFGTQGYQITDSVTTELFKVEYHNGGGNLFNLDLILCNRLDREKKDFYLLTVEAFDGGVPPRTGRQQLHVHVLDENDNPPVFNQSEYEALVWEDAPLLTPLCQVYATDLDLGDNGRVVYEINRRQTDPDELFIIDSTTGLISVNKALDYEVQPYYELIVRARDNGTQPEYSSAFVVVRVLDLNDNSPTIGVMFLSESGEPEVSEGAGIGEYVARISVSDPDLGLADKVRVSLVGGEGRFSLKPSDDHFLFFLCVDGELDREKADFYELKLVASDFGAPPLWSESTFFIKVTDVNDCRPVFGKEIHTVNISENVPPGSVLMRLQAKDLDEGVNSAVHYSIVQSMHDYLVSIDSTSGLVTTAAPIDREREVEIQFLVAAVDGGSPPLSSTARVTVFVEDVNDNEPVFEKQLYNVSVPEHSQVGSCFLQVAATDADDGDFGRVKYSLFDGFDDPHRQPLFSVIPDSGEICISQDIDRDSGTVTHNIFVTAEDWGGLSAQTYVHIEMEDINDNRPEFSPEKYVTSISSHTQPGTEILNVIAADRDSGTFGHVSYKLLPGDLSSFFTVDKSTGVLFLTSTLSHVGATSVKLSVSADDGAGLSSARPAEVTVNILRGGLAPAVFRSSRYAFVVSEDAPAGTAVGTVQAVSTSNSLEPQSYRISSGDPRGLFTVHPQTGLISTDKALDHEIQPFFLLLLQSYTGTSPTYSSTQVNVTVTDVNDNPPEFSKDRDVVTISQSTLPGTVLFIAHAHDRDSGPNGEIRYALQGGDTKSFSIDPCLGTVVLNKSLSRDVRDSYALKILAEDGGVPSLTSTLILTINVDRVASEDNLAFETLVYQVEISESAHRDTRVVQVRAHGQRLRASYAISYSLGSTPERTPFGIHAESGWMFLTWSLDHESVSEYHLTVLATALESRGVLSATATVVVTILDENDNTPVFTQDAYFFTIEEGPFPQGLIGNVKATDRDTGRNSLLSYILLSDGKHFRINSKTGEIINWVAVDREQHTHHDLKVLVTDHGLPCLNATTHIYILVTDINDNPPQFTHLPAGKELNVQVWAGLPAGSVVATMYAKDLDAGENGTVQYTYLSDDAIGYFEIDSRSGEIRTTGNFSAHPRPYYTLTIAATDNGSKPLEETAVIHLQILPPERQRGHADSWGFREFSVREDSRPGKVIGSLRLAEERYGEMQYFIAEGDGSIHFGIDSTSGDLYISQELDYEMASHYLLKVCAADGGRSQAHNGSVFVSVRVEDVNDHTPWFLADVVVFGVQENLPVGASVHTFNAKDGDGSWPNSALRYYIVADSASVPFHIDPVTGTLTTIGPVDREQFQSWVFTVTATDQAEDPSDRRQAALTTQIFLLDVNDNSPVFVSLDQSQVFEDAEVGSLLHRFVAKDEDLGENGRVTYSILSGNDDRLFTLREQAGLLYLASSLDYESSCSHTVAVKAVDGGRPQRSSTQTLTVSVLDVNDHAPLFERGTYTATVPENRQPGEPVIRVTAFDQDSGWLPCVYTTEMNAAVRYSLQPGPGFGHFAIDSHTGEITTAVQLDREHQRHFTLRVLARDGGAQPLSSTATVLCSVLDENDNSPAFLQPVFHISIHENLPPGVIYTAQADDPDAGANGTIRYRIDGEGIEGCFVINATTGAISTLRGLDREERSSYSILIEAHDQSLVPRSSPAQLSVLVLDKNDNSPVFSEKNYRASVSEDLPVGSEVLRLTASDSDEGPNGEVTFSLLDDTLGTFMVEDSTGMVRTSQPLNRETRSQYTFQAVATDSCSQGPRSSVATVTVYIEDVNDNAPVFNQNPLNSLVSIDTGINQAVVTVRADDSDRGENGTVVFRLSEPDSVFLIDNDTGEIRLKTSLPPTSLGMKVLHVIASDQGTPGLSSSCLVLIHLREEEARLWFTERTYEAAIPENSKTDSWVMNVVAQDGSNGRRTIKYNIFNGNGDEAFSINPYNGDISVKDQRCLDFEERREVHLVVLANNGQQTAHCRVIITLLDVNDNAPTFQQNDFKTAVWEGQIHNTYVMQVVATDADSGLNGQLEYSILSGNHNEAFLIDSVRGILASNTFLDREILSSYKLVLEAVDRGSPPLTGTATVRVQVVDVNDNDPVIPPMEPVAVAENLPAGHSVTQVTANDVDLSSTMTYSFADHGNGSGSFLIDRYTGIITLTQSLDREEESQHLLRIRASDSIHQIEAEVQVLVLDVNDNAPVFSRECYQTALPEFTPIDTFVLTVSASDRDSGFNGQVSYRLLSSPSKGFYISLENGSLYTNKPLTSITNGNMIQLLVEARDHGDPALTAVTSVDIQVQDANDHPPQFPQATYQASIPEDTPVGSTLLSLSAFDQDWSSENTHLEYAITGGNQERRFCMEVGMVRTETQQRAFGKLVLCDALDRETMGNYTLVVTANDRGTPPLSSSTMVTVAVLDVNDNAPVFSSTEYRVQVSESSPLGSRLAQVSAYDPDEGVNAQVKYDIVSGNGKGNFKLDSRTGTLVLNQSLDYEEDDKFTLTIQASDGDRSGSRNVAFAVAFVTVLDENDNSPYFMFPTVNCSVMENLPAFSPVCAVRALDRDTGPYGQLSYSILSSCFMDYGSGSPDRKEAFAMDPLTGEIHTKQVFDYERDREYCFLLEARDKGDQAATVRVQIDIEGVDEFSPVFTQQQYLFELPEKARAGQSIGQVIAMDHDGGLDGIVEYSLTSSSSFFSVNKTSGGIYLSGTVYEIKDSLTRGDLVELMIIASSPKVDSKLASCLVTVNISNSAKAMTGLAINVQTICFAVVLIVFLLIFISIIALVLRHKKKEFSFKKGVPSTTRLNQSNETFGSSHEPNGINLQYLKSSVDIHTKKEPAKPCRNSDSSGRGSAEVETAEDEEIKMINEHPIRKNSGSVLSDRASRIPDSGIPRDPDQLSSHSEDGDLEPAAAGIGMESSESLNTFTEEAGGEEMLMRVVKTSVLADSGRGYASQSKCNASVDGSLTSLVCSEEELRGSYSWDYLLNWEPRFQPLASVFSDIGQLPDETAQAKSLLREPHGLFRPPPLITSVAQPGIRTVPPRMPVRMAPMQMPTLMRRPSFPKYAYSPLARNTGLTPSAMTPSFSPALSLLTMRTPNASPVVSETGLGGPTKAPSYTQDGDVQPLA